ncbi:MAG: acyl-ACP--UDP-N-acetylglucosamine O-acyltransferase [Bacteroidetes bacterium]|jgi:UDP-N-acetylglucosamine acyltransferase|nr:acyl-ACP--UDP-N-acetylglucosamine O-acyltransferase [Bacteroidota bacterium]
MIHPLALVHPDAQIGDGTEISAFSTIAADVVIGQNCWIGPNATIMDGARLGDRVRVFPGAVVSAVPQDLKYKGEPTLTFIGHDTTIRECATINRGTLDRQETRVGTHCLLMAYSHVAHDCLVGDHVILANLATLAGHIRIHDWAILEGMVAVQQFITVGEHTFIGGGSLVRKDVPPYVKCAKEPLSFAGVNVIGLRRRGFSEESIRQIEDIYRLIYVRGHNMSKALELVEQESTPSEERDRILQFIKSSQPGVIKGMLE